MKSITECIINLLPGIQKVKKKILPQFERETFVIDQLKKLPEKSLILDAGCGSQIYRKHCAHLEYRAQDFGKYTIDEKTIIGTKGIGGDSGYKYGHLDYIGDIWNIDEKDETFDVVLCTEVFEHIPYPIKAVKELSRLLKPNGTLILTAPSNCLRHMDPYFFYSGFSDRWYEKILCDNGFWIESLKPVGDYFSWMALETSRTIMANSIFAKLIVMPAFLYYLIKTKTAESRDTLCQGYLIVAKKYPTAKVA